MTGAYNLKHTREITTVEDCYEKLGDVIYATNITDVKSIIQNSTNDKGELDASKIQQAMFPTIDADIFLSHSSSDIGLAKLIAGQIQYVTNKRVFIDSAFWGNMYDLEYEINDKYSRIGEDLFSYSRCLRVASNTRMLLATALSKMIYKTPYFIFLNTSKAMVESNTTSPWIYYEILTANQFLPVVKKSAIRLDEQTEPVFSYNIERYIADFEEVDMDGLLSAISRSNRQV